MILFTTNSPDKTGFSVKYAVAMLVLFVFANSLFGQTLLKYIPSTADVVVTLNLPSLDKKVNLAQLEQYDFYQSMLKDMNKTPEMAGDSFLQEFTNKLLTDPVNLGFSKSEPYCLFMKKVGYDTYITTLQKLDNKATYEATVRRLKGEAFSPNLSQVGNMNIWQKGRELFAWNNEVVINVIHQKGYDPNTWQSDYGDETSTDYIEENYDSSYFEDYAEEETMEADTVLFIGENGDTTRVVGIEKGTDWESKDSAEMAMVIEKMKDGMGNFDTLDSNEEPKDFSDIYAIDEHTFDFMETPDTGSYNWALKVLSLQYLQPITQNERFMMAKGRTNDLHFWMDYSFFRESMTSMQAASLGMGAADSYQKMISAMGGMMDVFYGDTYLSMGLNFEDGRMAVRSQMFFNDDLKRFYSRALDTKFNKKFLHYVKGGDEMFGYFYLNYNIKNTIEESKTLLYKIFEATPQYGEAAADAMKILGIFIDEDAVGNLLKGDLMLAVSGIQTVETTIQTYDYDADFNYTPRDTTVMKQVPIFTALASYGNGKDIQKFIDLGIHSKVLTPESNYYKIEVPNMGGMAFYLAKHDGLLIFTNNPYLMRQNLEKGFDKKLRLPKNHKKRLCDSASVMYWNIPNTIHSAAGSEANSNIGMMGYLNNIAKEFYSMEMTSSKKVGNSVDSEMFLNMTKKDANALKQFFDFVNDLYLETIGGAKI